MQSIDEIFKDIEGFEGHYQISNYGTVKSLDRDIYCINNGTYSKRHVHGRILKLTPDADGYLRVIIVKDGKSYNFGVHRLVAQAFISNPNDKPTVNHKDGNKQNNHVDNLEWATYQEQSDHAVKIGLRTAKTYANRENVKKALSYRCRCIETGQEFESEIEATRQLQLNDSAVWQSIHDGGRPIRSKKTGLSWSFERI